MRYLVALLVGLLAVVPAAGAGATSIRPALVIGISAYPALPVPNAVGDARAVARRLEQLRFDVTLAVDVGGPEMAAAIAAFANSIGPNSDAVIYFVGFGVRLRGLDLIVPVDAPLGGETAEAALLLGGAVPVDAMLRLLAGRGARTVLVMLDTNFKEAGSEIPQGWTTPALTLPDGMVVSLAALPGTLAMDGPPGGNGPYTAALLAALGDPGLSVDQVLARIADGVPALTGGTQRTWSQGKAHPLTVLNYGSMR